MVYPRIKSVEAKGDHLLVIEFEDSSRRIYDVAPLFKREPFTLLQNPAFFKAVKVDSGGYAVCWSDDIDLSEYELWSRGRPV